MKLKRFVAADTRSAMQQIKATFGPDAVICPVIVLMRG